MTDSSRCCRNNSRSDPRNYRFCTDSPAVSTPAFRCRTEALHRPALRLIPANGGKATDEVFSAPDAFGLAYRTWNAKEKDRVFEMVRSRKGQRSKVPTSSPQRSYTEPYMVKFLVQNSLGATWMMMHPESEASTTWEYYVKDADRTPNEKKPVAEITFLDPRVRVRPFPYRGLRSPLYVMYEEEGQLKESAAICQSILNNNLFGIDIDERAVQITKAVLWMKAAETSLRRQKSNLQAMAFRNSTTTSSQPIFRLPNGKDHLDAS